MGFIWNILLLSIAVFAVAKLMPRIHIASFWTALIVGLVYSIINLIVGSLLTFLALPLIFITFGLFKFVINAFLLWITDKLVDDFEIEDVLTTLVAALMITLFDSGLKWIL